MRNKAFSQGGQMRANMPFPNMGNIYFEQGNWSAAIKQYRQALDNVPASARELRYKILRNIGHAFVRMGQYAEALRAYDDVMEHSPDVNTGLNQVVCYYALGDKDKMRKAFARLVAAQPPPEAEEDDEDEARRFPPPPPAAASGRRLRPPPSAAAFPAAALGHRLPITFRPSLHPCSSPCPRHTRSAAALRARGGTTGR